MVCQHLKFPNAPFPFLFLKSIKCIFKQHKMLLSAIALPSGRVMLQAWHYWLCWWNWISLSYWFWCTLVRACGLCIDLSKKLLRSGGARSVVCVLWELTGALILCQQPVAHLDIDPLWGKLALVSTRFSSICAECFDPSPQQVCKGRLSGWVASLLRSLLRKKSLKYLD